MANVKGYGLVGGTAQERFQYATKLRRSGVRCDYDMRERKIDKQVASMEREGFIVVNIEREECWV